MRGGGEFGGNLEEGKNEGWGHYGERDGESGVRWKDYMEKEMEKW